MVPFFQKSGVNRQTWMRLSHDNVPCRVQSTIWKTLLLNEAMKDLDDVIQLAAEKELVSFLDQNTPHKKCPLEVQADALVQPNSERIYILWNWYELTLWTPQRIFRSGSEMCWLRQSDFYVFVALWGSEHFSSDFLGGYKGSPFLQVGLFHRSCRTFGRS